MSNSTYHSVAELRALPSGEKRAFSGVFILRRLASKKAKNGNDFLSIELGDNTGSFPANCWQDAPAYTALAAAKEGDVVEVQGITDYYREAFSPALRAARALSEEEVQSTGALERLVKVSPEDPAKLWEEFQGFIAAIPHEGLRLTVQAAVAACEDIFRVAPAALAMHQAYRFGLLEHTVHVVRVAKALLPLYPEVDPSLAIAGCLLHDIGKVEEYGEGRAATRSREGRLIGHVVIGYRMARRAAMSVAKDRPGALDTETLERLEHIILSHQGNLEWGAATLAATPEAVFVSLVDNLDAKMAMVQENLREAAPGAEFSEFVKGLGVNLLLSKPSAIPPAASGPAQETLL